MAKKILLTGTPKSPIASEAFAAFYPDKVERQEDRLLIAASAVYPYNPLSGNSELPVVSSGRNKVAQNVAAGSDKSLTVPAGKRWLLRSIYAKLVNSATVGNRQIVVSITDGTTEVNRVLAGAVSTAGLTVFYNFYSGAISMAAFVASCLTGSLPELVLLPGYVVRVYDSAAVDAATDVLATAISYEEFDQ